MMEKGIGGTLVWYYTICPRQVWLMAHNILPEESDKNIVIGRLIDEMSYTRERRRKINLDNTLVIDMFVGEDVVGEVKKSSASLESAQLQLAYYLYYLKHKKGVLAKGLLMVPEERRRYSVELTPEMEARVADTIEQIEVLRAEEKPRPAKKIKYCKKCAYAGMCWS